MTNSKSKIVEDLNLHKFQQQILGEFKEFTMPIVRSGFPSTPLNELYKKQIMTAKPASIKWNFVYSEEDKKWNSVDELPREQVESESDEFVLTGAL